MTSLFKAAQGLSNAKEQLGVRSKNKYSPILRWVGLGVAGLVVVVGILSFFLPTADPLIWAGIYGCVVGLVVAVFQSGLEIVNRLLGFLLEVYYWRAAVFIALSIGCYFAPILIVAGVCLDLLALAYLVVAFIFRERDYFDEATIAREEQRAQARVTLDRNTAPPPGIV